MRKVPRALLGLALVGTVGCGGSTPPPAPPPPASDRPPPPSGPTRTDFRVIARRLVARCTGGGWIERWRSEHPDIDVAKPRIRFERFEDDTEEGLDTAYLGSVLEGRMRLSGVYDMVTRPEDADFFARGRVARMAERAGGARIPVYVTTLEIVEPESGRRVRRCEAVVEGEL